MGAWEAAGRCFISSGANLAGIATGDMMVCCRFRQLDGWFLASLVAVALWCDSSSGQVAKKAPGAVVPPGAKAPPGFPAKGFSPKGPGDVRPPGVPPGAPKAFPQPMPKAQTRPPTKAKKKDDEPTDVTLVTKESVNIVATFYPGTAKKESVPVIMVHAAQGQ